MQPRVRLLSCFLALTWLAAPGSTQGDATPAPAPPPTPSGETSLSARFHEDLTPFGTWMTLAPHGEVWKPRDMPADWRPYSTGHWVLAQDVGWTWMADEPWGWAPFHYGRWLLDPTLGWVWIPGEVWGPAWVAWRSNDEFVGWAPLPPAVGWSVGVGLAYGDADLDLVLAEPCWCFVPVRHLCHPHVREVLVRENVTVVLRQTRIEKRNILIEGGRVVHRPIPVERVEQASGAAIPRVTLREFDRAEALRGAPLGPSEVAILRPRTREEPLRPGPRPGLEGHGHRPSGLQGPHAPGGRRNGHPPVLRHPKREPPRVP